MEKVFFDRLVDMAGIISKSSWNWPGSEPFSLDDVLTERKNGLSGSQIPYGDTWKHPANEERGKLYHMARIIHFMDHPEEIAGIEVDNNYSYNTIFPECVIVDGWHRVAAGILIGLETVEIEYGGRSDIEDYLSGKSNNRPLECIVL